MKGRIPVVTLYMKLPSRDIRLDTCSVPNETGDVRLIFCRLTRNDVIGRFPSNVGVHRRANQRAPTSNTMTLTGGSGTSVEVGRKCQKCHMVVITTIVRELLDEHMFVLLIVQDMFDVVR